MSYTLELNSGDELEINFSALNNLLMTHGYNTSDMYFPTHDEIGSSTMAPYITFTDPSETYPTTIELHRWCASGGGLWDTTARLYINQTDIMNFGYESYKGSYYERLSEFDTQVWTVPSDPEEGPTSIRANIKIVVCVTDKSHMNGRSGEWTADYTVPRLTLPIEFSDAELHAVIHKKSTYPWTTPVTERTNESVIEAENNRYPSDTSGMLNYADLNRIETNTIYVKEYMYNRLIVQTMPSMTHKTNWVADEAVDSVNMTRIIENVRRLMELSNPVIKNDLLPLSVSNLLTYRVANAIEHNLDIMHTQPDLVVPKYRIRLNDGIIQETGTNEGEFEADRAIHIIAEKEFTGVDKYTMGFNYWSGDANDLQYIGNINDNETVFFCQHHDTTLTANFQNKKIVKVVIEGGCIYGSKRDSTIGWYRYYDTSSPIGMPNSPCDIQGGQCYANIGETLTIKYAPGSNATGFTPHLKYGPTYGNSNADTRLIFSRFVKWHFYYHEPYMDGLHEINEGSVLLNDCNAPSTMIKVPNVSTLIARPELIFIPNRITMANTILTTDSSTGIEEFGLTRFNESEYGFELRKRIYFYG